MPLPKKDASLKYYLSMTAAETETETETERERERERERDRLHQCSMTLACRNIYLFPYSCWCYARAQITGSECMLSGLGVHYGLALSSGD